ncbi:hypothetical protein [Palleronia sp.]|uniref:hypothetical protein n=1 Tax=Palleronia sp. TaxID=1940284 RepID=UPI0035C8330B
MTDQKNASPLRTLICRLLGGTCCGASGEELAALRAENDALRAELQDTSLHGPAPAPAVPTAMDCETEIDTLFCEFVRECSVPPHRGRFDDPNPIEVLSRSLGLLADAHGRLGVLQYDRELEWEDPEAGKRYLGLISGKAKEISEAADHMALVLDPEKYRAMIRGIFAEQDAPTSAPEPDHGDSWEYMQTIAQGVSAEREAFEALAGEQDPSPSDDDEWASLAEDEDPITDAEIADTLGALFDAAAEIRAERLASEAEASAAAEQAPEASVETVAEAVEAAPEAVEQGEPQPDVSDGWSERTVYGVTVSGAIQDKAWADWLAIGDLRKSELARLLRDDSYENRIATETANRMLQHSRAKAKVRLRANASTYHLVGANDYQLRHKAG